MLYTSLRIYCESEEQSIYVMQMLHQKTENWFLKTENKCIVSIDFPKSNKLNYSDIEDELVDFFETNKKPFDILHKDGCTFDLFISIFTFDEKQSGFKLSGNLVGLLSAYDVSLYVDTY